MAKIVLSKDAPEGQPLSAAFGPSSFDAGRKQSFVTDDPILIEGAENHKFFDVEYDESVVADQPGSQTVARDEAKRFNAEKDITEDPQDPNVAAQVAAGASEEVAEENLQGDPTTSDPTTTDDGGKD